MNRMNGNISVCRTETRRGGFRSVVVLLVILAGFSWGAPKSHGFSLALDSIAEWGRFPRFCIDTYRWGAGFFNSYDSTYVQGSGKLFNAKTRVQTWTDSYHFRFENGYNMEMMSNVNTSLGFYLTYMAVSVGYDMNVSKYFNGGEGARKRFNLQFNCSLFAAEYYSQRNDVGTKIRRMGPKGASRKVDIPFKGINTSSWGVDVYYFFNHKHYSQAAALYYSKIQVRSAGSMFAGLALFSDDYHFDFSELTDENTQLPPTWDVSNYQVKHMNYALRVGYAYNWVFHPGWVLGVWEAPAVGFCRGYINDPTDMKYTFALTNRLRASLVYNHKKRWFFGMVLNADTGLIYDKEHNLLVNNFSVEASAGFRFNLW